MKIDKILAVTGTIALVLAIVSIIFLAIVGLLEQYYLVPTVLCFLSIIFIDISGRIKEKRISKPSKQIDEIRKRSR